MDNPIVGYDAATGKQIHANDLAEPTQIQTNDQVEPDNNYAPNAGSPEYAKLVEQNAELLNRCQYLDAKYLEVLSTLFLLARVDKHDSGYVDVINEAGEVSESIAAIALRAYGHSFLYDLPKRWADAISSTVQLVRFGGIEESEIRRNTNIESINALREIPPKDKNQKYVLPEQLDAIVKTLVSAAEPAVCVSFDEDINQVRIKAAIAGQKFIMDAIHQIRQL